jgi:cytoskeletal protein CcmA (bactofilin family)
MQEKKRIFRRIFMKLNKDTRNDIAGFMGPGTEIQGELRFKEAVRVDGKFSGTVESEGSLLVGETGVIVAKIKIGRLSVSGQVEGSICATEKVEILHTGKIIGDVTTPILVVEEGAILEGKCSMMKNEPAVTTKTPVHKAIAESNPKT